MWMSFNIFFFFLKTSRDTLDLKLNVKCNLSNMHTNWMQLKEEKYRGSNLKNDMAYFVIHSLPTTLLIMSFKHVSLAMTLL